MGCCVSHSYEQISKLLGIFHKLIYMLNMEKLKREQISREVGLFHLEYVTRIMVYLCVQPGCEYGNLLLMQCLFYYKQDVGCTHFCLFLIRFY